MRTTPEDSAHGCVTVEREGAEVQSEGQEDDSVEFKIEVTTKQMKLVKVLFGDVADEKTAQQIDWLDIDKVSMDHVGEGEYNAQPRAADEANRLSVSSFLRTRASLLTSLEESRSEGTAICIWCPPPHFCPPRHIPHYVHRPPPETAIGPVKWRALAHVLREKCKSDGHVLARGADTGRLSDLGLVFQGAIQSEWVIGSGESAADCREGPYPGCTYI